MRLCGLLVVCAVCTFVLNGSKAETSPGPAKKVDSTKADQPLGADQLFGIEKRTLWTTSRVVGSPEPPLPYRLERRFEKLKLFESLYMVPEPGSERMFLIQHDGKIFEFPDDNTVQAATLFHDLKRDTYSVICHPNYEQNRYLFAFSKGKGTNRIARYEVSRYGSRKVIPGSETVIIEWISGGHDGGDMAFDNDGYFYITGGDGSNDADGHNNGQNITTLNATIIRIDVDHPDEGKAYSIPPDNPFLHIPEARPEIWAFGTRNPWRMSFDPPSGNLWVGDVGQDLWEMIYVVQRGDNYGWSVREGTHPYLTARKLGPAPVVPPLIEHPHSIARSITGGYVYRGSRLPELVGAYIYGDYETGLVWGMRYENGKITQHRLLANSPYRIVAFGRDHAGEIYAIDYSGELYWLEPIPLKDKPQTPFPIKLSETGLFSSVIEQQPTQGVIPFSVNAPAWNDGASKKRFLGIPGEGQIVKSENRGWGFVEGTVLAETISLETEQGNPASSRRIESRLLTMQEGEWYGYSYMWNDEQTDATLVAKEGLERKFKIIDPDAPGGVRVQTWRYPSRVECMVCHTRSQGFVLGLNTLQMDKVHDYGHVADNQIRTFDHMGLFKLPETVSDDDDPPDKKKPPKPKLQMVNPYDESADLDARARSYLHVNCSHCHIMFAGGNAKILLEFSTEPSGTHMFDEVPTQSNFGLFDARIVASGDPYRSVLFYRMSKIGPGRMPRLGSALIDERGVNLIHDWIRQMPANSEGEPPDNSNGETSSDPKSNNPDDSKSKSPTNPKSDDQEKSVAKLRLRQRATLGKLRASDGLSQEVLAETVDQLSMSTSGGLMLLHALHNGDLPKTRREQIIQRAVAHADAQVRDLFERFLPEEQRIKRLGSVINPAALLALQGDAKRGKQVFFNTEGVQCKSCHRIDNTGREIGPGLNEIGKKLNRSQLLESMLEPSKDIDPKFVTYVVQTFGGKSHSGLMVKKTAEEIILKDNDNKLITIPADDVEELIAQPKSMMPELLLREMTAQQVADLLEYLGSLK